MTAQPTHPRRRFAVSLSIALAIARPAFAADDNEALNLQASPTPERPTTSNLRLALEGAAQFMKRPAGQGDEHGHRVSVDLRWSHPIGPGWRFGLSNRLDDQKPIWPGQRSTRNSLRELQLSWQDTSGNVIRTVDIGRVNQRHGQAYGYNPSDFLRIGATPAIVSADPVAIRENRLGTFMVSGSQLWDGAGLTVAFVPRLARTAPDNTSWTLDLAATNRHNRVLAVANLKASEQWSGEVLAMHDGDGGMRYGLNLTGLLADAVVMHMEWAASRSQSLIDQLVSPDGGRGRHQQQAALGLTYTFGGGLSLTAESEYNEAGLNRGDWQAVFARGPLAVTTLLSRTQASQELAARHATLLYATKKDFLWRSLDLTAFVRRSTADSSRMIWGELRYRWPMSDLALQWQLHSGGAETEYGGLPLRRALQLLGTYRF